MAGDAPWLETHHGWRRTMAGDAPWLETHHGWRRAMARLYLSCRAARPGRSLPSSISRLAPPPVEMWLILPAHPACSTAATDSPPPMTVVAPLSATSLA